MIHGQPRHPDHPIATFPLFPSMIHLPTCATVFLLALLPLSACASGPADAAMEQARAPGQYRPEPGLERAGAWQSLFNGKDLTGWRAVNGSQGRKGSVARFEVQDGCIVGTNVKDCSWNSFLRTEQGYSDFVFTCDFKWDQFGNSGVQIRSHQLPWGRGAWDGRVWGYQVEMDDKARAWTGGLQEEGWMKPARGWLHDLKGPRFDAARNAVKLKDWNRLTVRAIGPRIETWINGVPCTDYTEEKISADTQSGFFALQVHYGRDISQVRWRNLKVLPLGPVQAAPFPAPPEKKK